MSTGDKKNLKAMSRNYLPAIIDVNNELKQQQQQTYQLMHQLANEVVVVRGRYDKVEDIFDALEVDHKVIFSTELYYDYGNHLDPDKILFINCPGDIGTKPGAYGKGADKNIQAIQSFVVDGGWLITTDWALSNIIEPCFRGTLTMIGKSTTGHDTVSIQPIESPITKNVTIDSDFWLEPASHLFTIDNEHIVPLITSNELNEKYGQTPILCYWNCGNGKIFHMVSHFILQKGRDGGTVDVRDASSSIYLLTNILAQFKHHKQS